MPGMRHGKRTAAIALVLLSVLVVLLWLTRLSEGTAGAGPPLATDSSSAGSPRPGSSPDRPDGAGTGERVEVFQPRESGTGPVGLKSNLLTGRVVEPAGAPVAGATVRLLQRIADGIGTIDPDYNDLREELAESDTEPDGTFAFRVPAFRPLMLEIRASGYGTRTVPDCYAGGDYVITLQAAAVIEGLVMRAADASPISGTKVRLFQPRRFERLLVTDSRGFYRFEGLPAESFRLEVLPPSDVTPAWATLEPLPGQVLRHNVLVESGGLVAGTVTDASTGEPIEGAEIGETWNFRRTVRTDAEGQYLFPGLPATSVPDLHVRAEGYGRQGKPVDDLEDGKKVLDFQLLPAGTTSGRIVDPQGRALPGIYVAGVASMRNPETRRQEADWQADRTDENGRFRIVNLSPDLPHALLVRHPGQGMLVYEFPELPSPEHTIEFGDVVLRPGAAIVGRVADGNGRGFPGQAVTLTGTNGDRLRYKGHELTPENVSAGGSYVTIRRAATGENGAFHFPDLSPGEYVAGIRLESKRIEQKITVSEWGSLVDDVVLIVDSGSSIQGTVITGDGTLLSSGTVRVESEIPGGSSGFFSVRDGRFGTSDLQPGTYRVIAIPTGGDDDDPWFVGEVAGVKAGTVGLQIALARAAWIEGKVVDAAGVGVSGLSVFVEGPEGILRDAPRSTWRTGDDGGYRVRVAEGEIVKLTIGPPIEVTRSIPGNIPPPHWSQSVVVEGVAAGTRGLVIRIK